MRKRVILFLAAILFGAIYPAAEVASPRFVAVIRLEDQIISPVMADFVADSIETAFERNAACLVMELDTPGGLLDATRSIVKKILNAPLPVIVYVSPSGSRATSAGVFITAAAHVAAMAPSTHMGAAHPVQIGMPGMRSPVGDETSKKDTLEKGDANDEEQKTADKPSSQNVLSEKIMQDTLAWVDSIAKARNRNREWLRESVEKSRSVTEDEALRLGVIDLVAPTLSVLLETIDGREVDVRGQPWKLETQGASLENFELSPSRKILNVLSDPNIAYILMILGMIGLIFEFSHPGVGFPGIAGLICLLLAFYSFNTLPVNYAGVALIALSVVLFVSELFTPTFGFLTLFGVISLIIGSLMLIETGYPFLQISLAVIVSMAGLISAFIAFLLFKVLRIHQTPVTTGREGLVGSTARVEQPLVPEGKVFCHGERWNARSKDGGRIEPGSEVRVVEVRGLLLVVETMESLPETGPTKVIS